MKREYKLKYEPSGTVFHTTFDPPKLIRLGSGHILVWVNTRYIDGIHYAVYRDAEIEDYTYIHMSDVDRAI